MRVSNIFFAVLFCVLIGITLAFSLNDGLDKSLYDFISAPSKASWLKFETDVKSDKLYPDREVYLNLLEYHDACGHRDWPNSMALIGITPTEYVAQQVKRINSALDYIQAHETEKLWRLLEALALQSFDEDFLWTAGELVARLSPDKFDIFTTRVVKVHPRQAWIIERIRERWLGSK